MKRNYRTAYNALKKLGCPVFERSDYPDHFLISAEEPESHQWADYYANYAQWDGEKTSPVLDKILRKNGLFAEWETSGCLIVCEI
jgi:hypothetical protein